MLRISTSQEEGVMEVSKHLKFQVLLDDQEMKDLIHSLEPLSMYIVSSPVGENFGKIEPQEFLQKYAQYVDSLKKGVFPEEASLRPYFSSIITRAPDILYAMRVGEKKYLIKALRPIVQLQLHHFSYSTVDKKVHPMAHGKNSITWGLQFSYPQIFQDPRTRSFCKVIAGPEFPNTEVFQGLSKWLRAHTLPTPFIAEEQKTNLPIRLGKQCFAWINQHPGLVKNNFKIESGLRDKRSIHDS